VAELEAAGARGALIGNAYETRATIALAMHEPAAFELWAERCRVHYAQGDSAALRAKFGRLMRQARQRGSDQLEIRVADISTTRPREGTLTTVMERMQRCVSPAERARCALRMILEQVGATEGHLFGLLEGKLKHLASVSDAPFDMTLGPEPMTMQLSDVMMSPSVLAVTTTAYGLSPGDTTSASGEQASWASATEIIPNSPDAMQHVQTCDIAVLDSLRSVACGTGFLLSFAARVSSSSPQFLFLFLPAMACFTPRILRSGPTSARARRAKQKLLQTFSEYECARLSSRLASH
jgi:hypothetical protein